VENTFNKLTKVVQMFSFLKKEKKLKIHCISIHRNSIIIIFKKIISLGVGVGVKQVFSKGTMGV